MAQQFLDRAQVAAAGQQMGGEAVAKGVRRRRFRQPQEHSDPAHLALSAFTTTLLALAFFLWSVHLFKREKIFLLG